MARSAQPSSSLRTPSGATQKTQVAWWGHHRSACGLITSHCTGGPGLASACAGIYGSQSREDYSEDDIEHYFNYMGMLATEV